jgi:hypothetical protein
MAVTVTLTFDTVEQLLAAFDKPLPYIKEPICQLGPDDGREPFTTPVATQDVLDPFDVIMNLFDNGKYNMRTVKTLAEKSGISGQMVFDLLDKHDISYNVKHRRSDGAQLIELA